MEMSLYTNPGFSKLKCLPPNPRSSITTMTTVSCSPAMSCKKVDFYDVLSLGSKNVHLDEIKKAYRSMALRFHPDVCPPDAKKESTRRFVELKKAYETLSDPVSREQHDYELGFLDSVGSWGKGGVINRNLRSSTFSRQVWEDQLVQLKLRSQLRMQRKKKSNHNP